MSSARARFKYALRQCRLDEQIISSDKLAYITCSVMMKTGFGKKLLSEIDLNRRCLIVLMGHRGK